jgi:hypothetical protein
MRRVIGMDIHRTFAEVVLYSTAQLVEQKRSALVSRRLVWMTPLQLSQRDGFIMRY